MCERSHYKKTYKDAQFVVEQNFKNHKIVKIWSHNNYSWFCVGTPNSSLFGFKIAFFNDGVITFTGDIGNFILKVSESDSLNWLISTLRGKQLPVDYIVSKIVTGKKFDWYEEDLKDFLESNKELPEDDPDKLPSEIVDYHYIDYSQAEFAEVVYNWNFEMCNMFENPSFDAILMICAMKWFVDNLEKVEENSDFEVIVE